MKLIAEFKPIPEVGDKLYFLGGRQGAHIEAVITNIRKYSDEPGSSLYADYGYGPDGKGQDSVHNGTFVSSLRWNARVGMWLDLGTSNHDGNWPTVHDPLPHEVPKL